jgi:hypothetical protein
MPVRSYAVTTHSSPASLRNPCPSGTGIGYASFNDTAFGDTLFVICSAAFDNNSNGVDLGLALGLGLGLGIPFLCLVGCLLYQKCCSRAYYEPSLNLKDLLHLKRTQTFPSLNHPVSVHERVRLYLTEEALSDFYNGNLSELLKKEIMMTRVREGRTLNEFVEAAKGWPEIAEWVTNLNPGDIPPAIRQEAILKMDDERDKRLLRYGRVVDRALEGGHIAPTTMIQVRPSEEV